VVRYEGPQLGFAVFGIIFQSWMPIIVGAAAPYILYLWKGRLLNEDGSRARPSRCLTLPSLMRRLRRSFCRVKALAASTSLLPGSCKL
jgi:hypothetical protein